MTHTTQRVLLSALLCGAAWSAPAAWAQQLKFGHFDSAQLLKEMPQVKQVESTINDEANKIEAQVTVLSEDFKKQLDDYKKKAATMTEAEASAKEEELQQMQERIETFVQTSRQDINKKQQELMAPILQSLLRTVQEVGAAGGYIYIFEKQAPLLVYEGAESKDVAPEVRKKLGLPAQK